jgi:ABC-type multidrug transport system permease subunit
MLAISIRVRQLLGTQTDPIQLKLRSSVLSVALAVVLAALVVSLVALTALTALTVSVVPIVSVVLIVFVAVIAAADAAVAVARLNISRFLTKTMIAKVPAVVAGAFLYKVKHMKQVMVHRMIAVVVS